MNGLKANPIHKCIYYELPPALAGGQENIFLHLLALAKLYLSSKSKMFNTSHYAITILLSELVSFDNVSVLLYYLDLFS